jgi:hypothetical protein
MSNKTKGRECVHCGASVPFSLGGEARCLVADECADRQAEREELTPHCIKCQNEGPHDGECVLEGQE